MISERTVLMDNPKIEIEKVNIPDVKNPAEGELAESELNKVSGGGYGYGNQDKYSGS
jgi:hypothetical protein